MKDNLIKILHPKLTIKKSRKDNIIQENISLVEKGKPLIFPLRQLNGAFKSRYNGLKKDISTSKYKDKIKKYRKEYYKNNKTNILKKKKMKKTTIRKIKIPKGYRPDEFYWKRNIGVMIFKKR